MSQTQISYFDAHGYVSIPCPQCGEDVYVDMPIFFTALNDFEKIECVDCGFEFYVELDLQDSRGLTLRAAVQSEQGGAEYCKCYEYVPSVFGRKCGVCGKPPRPNRSDGG